MNKADRLRVVVLVDNLSARSGILTAYGLSLLLEADVRGRRYRVLFDTGPSYEILEHNSRMLGIDLTTVGHIVISHFHRDHYGALPRLLQIVPPGTLHVPEEPWFAKDILSKARKLGWRIARISRYHEVAPSIYAFGPVAWSLEASVEVHTKDGSVIIIGCGHAGVPVILSWARNSKRLAAVIGGFHIKEEPPEEACKLSKLFLSMGVGVVVPLHCSDHVEVFRKCLGKSYGGSGAGTILEIPFS